MYSRKGGMKVENRIEATIPVIKRALIKTNTNKKDHVFENKRDLLETDNTKKCKKSNDYVLLSYNIHVLESIYIL